MRKLLLFFLAAAFICVGTSGASPDLLTSLRVSEERSGTGWPSPPIERYQLQTDTKDVSIQQILAIIAERDRQYGQRFDAQEKAVINALAAAEKAVTTALVTAKEAVIKAETAAEKRFDSVNEFRAQLRDQANTFITIATANARFSDMERRLGQTEEHVSRQAGEGIGSQNLWGWIMGMAGLVGILFAGVTMMLRLRDKSA